MVFIDNMDKKDIKAQLGKMLNQQQDVEFAYLFGSIVRGDSVNSSDIDVAIFINEKNSKDFFEEKLRLTNILSEELTQDVDVVILNNTSLLMKFSVQNEGELIMEKDHSKRVDFELKAINEYFDFKPYREMYNQRTLNKNS